VPNFNFLVLWCAFTDKRQLKKATEKGQRKIGQSENWATEECIDRKKGNIRVTVDKTATGNLGNGKIRQPTFNSNLEDNITK